MQRDSVRGEEVRVWGAKGCVYGKRRSACTYPASRQRLTIVFFQFVLLPIIAIFKLLHCIRKNIEIPFESDQKHATPTPNSHNTISKPPKVHSVGPHALVRHQPGTKSIILQPSDPTVVGAAQFTENTGSLPHNDLGIEVSWRCPDHDLL